MDTQKSKGSTPSSPKVSVTTASARTNDIRPKRRIIQSFLLIWLDPNINQTSKDSQSILAQLESIANNVHTFTQREECVDFLKEVTDRKAFLIVDGTMGQALTSKIHDISHVHSIYVLCDNKADHKEWTKKWSKVKGVHTDIKSIYKALEAALKQHNQDYNAISIVDISKDIKSITPDQVDPSFLYAHIFKELLLEFDHSEQAIKDFIQFLRDTCSNNAASLDQIAEFERDYRPQSSIWWYSRESFIYQMLIWALQTLEVEIIMKMGFFIRDIHCQIKELHQQQFKYVPTKPFIVYRGQGLLKTDFDKLQKTKTALVSFNNFFSSNYNREVSLNHAENALSESDMVGVIFKMFLNPTVTTSHFASISNVSYFRTKEEVLFSMHTIFRVGEIKQTADNSRVWEIPLILVSDTDPQVVALTQRMKEEIEGDGWQRIGNVMIAMGHLNPAEEFYSELLKKITDDASRALIYHQLGLVKQNKGEYKESTSLYEKALAINLKILPPMHPNLGPSYVNIAAAHNNMGNYSKALEFYRKEIEIAQNTLPANHPGLAISCNNIGQVFSKLGEHSKAFEFGKRAHKILEKTLPPNHPDLAASCSNMAQLHSGSGDYEKALQQYEKSLKILGSAKSPDQPLVAACYDNIGEVYKNMGNNSKAVEYYEKAQKIYKKTLPSDHPQLAECYNHIGQVYTNMGDYSKAGEYYEKAHEIYKKIMPSNHPLLAECYNNIGQVYINKGEYSKALEFCEKVLEVYEKALPPNDPKIASAYSNIGHVHNRMGDYSKALDFYQKAHKIIETTQPVDYSSLAISHSHFAACYERMGDYTAALNALEDDLKIKQNKLKADNPAFGPTYCLLGRVSRCMQDYPKALQYFEKCVAIAEETLPEKHPNRAIMYTSIGDVHRLMGKYEMAITFHKKALDIQENAQCNPLECATTYANLGETYREMEDYPTALTYFQKALEIREKKLLKDHPDLAAIYHNLANLRLGTKEYGIAKKNAQQAVEIAQGKLSPNHPHLLEYKKTLEKIQKKS